MIHYEQYYIETTLTDDGKELNFDEVSKIVFAFGDIQKTFIPNQENENVEYDSNKKVYKIYLTQQETGSLQQETNYQVAVKYTDGDVRRTLVNTQYIYEDIIGVI